MQQVLQAADEVVFGVELAQVRVAVAERVQVVGDFFGQLAGLCGDDGDREGEETHEQAQGAYQHDRHRGPARQPAPVEPHHGRVEPERDEEREPEQDQYLARDHHRPRERDRERYAQRSHEADEERRASVEGRADARRRR